MARTRSHHPGKRQSHSLRRSVSTPNLRPEHGWMSRSSDQIVGGKYRMSKLTKLSGELCDSLFHAARPTPPCTPAGVSARVIQRALVDVGETERPFGCGSNDMQAAWDLAPDRRQCALARTGRR